MLLAAAARAIGDSRVEKISLESRFDAAYRAIMQAAVAALMANGFRPNTNTPGYHMTVLQILRRTILGTNGVAPAAGTQMKADQESRTIGL